MTTPPGRAAASNSAGPTKLVNDDAGRVSRRIFSDPELYELELDKIFTKTWLYIGHLTQIRQPGDYVTSWMAEDPVILTRDKAGEVRVLLNSCLHRGMTVCRSERGNSRFFRCPYHGWTYTNDGSLTGVPRFHDAYQGRLDKSQLGLVRVPRVDSYRGLVFATWDEDAPSLADYLGEDLRWYLDIPFNRALGELEVVGAPQKYLVKTNWKIPCENFSGDDYHVLHTHGSAFKLGLQPDYDALASYVATFRNGHGMGDIPLPDVRLQMDLEVAAALGPDVVDYVHAVHGRLAEQLDERRAALHSIGEGIIFPNFSWLDILGVMPIVLFNWHPRGVGQVEVTEYLLIDSATPPALRAFMHQNFSQMQSIAGFFGQDDTENFEQITMSSRGYVSRTRYDFDYTMGLGGAPLNIDGYPGTLGPHYTEMTQRNFLRRWRELMSV